MRQDLPLAGVTNIPDEDCFVVMDGDVEVVGTHTNAPAVQHSVDDNILLDGRKPVGGDRLGRTHAQKKTIGDSSPLCVVH